jgi:hypothetical protein
MRVKSALNLTYLLNLNSNPWLINHKFLMLNLYVVDNNAILIRIFRELTSLSFGSGGKSYLFLVRRKSPGV